MGDPTAAIWELVSLLAHDENLGWVKMRWQAAAMLGGCVEGTVSGWTASFYRRFSVGWTLKLSEDRRNRVPLTAHLSILHPTWTISNFIPG